MNELVKFLRARLDEDEADARARRGTYPSAVAWEDGRLALHAHEDGSAVIVRLSRPVERPGELIALKRWSLPVAGGWTASRVLREVEAKRQILRDYEQEVFHSEDILRTLATVYADHPDYREEWRP